MLVAICILSYFLERIMKFSFAQKYIQGNKLRCLTDAFQKVETGFMLIRANKISFMNIFLKQNMHKFFKRPLGRTMDFESNSLLHIGLPLRDVKEDFTLSQQPLVESFQYNYEESNPEFILKQLLLGLDLHNIRKN